MKLIFILCTAVLLNVNAATSYAQKVNLSVKNAPLEQVFGEITKQTGFNFLYNTQMLQTAKPLTISVKNTSLEEILELCFKEQELTYTISANTIIVKKKLEPSKSINSIFGLNKGLIIPNIISTVELQKPITGTVYDQLTKETLPGVSVKVKNGSAAVATDAQGKFSIPARSTDVLVATYLGYDPLEITVGTETKIDFNLRKNLNTLDEVVVVGYGTQAKRDLTGAITSVTSRDIMERSPINIYEALQGQSPGVQVSQSSGAPGASSSIIIRGIGTFGSGAAPLYIVDGAQGVNIDAINPQDIESIDILKDAASTSIYGSRGGNGVIIVTTKRGQDGKPEITANIVSTWGTLSHKVASPNANERRLYDVKLQGLTGALPTDSLNPGMNADVDALAAVTRVARKNDASVSLSGGSKNLRFLANMQYVGDESIVINSWSKQARFQINTDYSPSDKFTFTTNLLLGVRNGNNPLESSSLNEAVGRNPTYALYLPDGSLAPTINGRQNPVAWSLLYQNLAKAYTATLYNKATYKFGKDLVWSTDAALNYSNGHTFKFTPNSLGGAGVTVNTGTDGSTVGTNWMTQSYLNYSKNLGADNTISAVLGASAGKTWGTSFSLTGNTFVSDQVLTLNSAQTYGTPSNSSTASTTASAWARIGYDYKQRYHLTATIRADGSSKFGPQNRWGYFPSVGTAWNFSDEPFMSWANKILTSGKLRASYGIVGNDQSLGNYDAIQQYVFGTNFYNGVSGVVLNSSYGNPKLSWEVNKQLDIGTDLSMFKGRASVTVDYYNKITNDLLYQAPLVLESGFSSVNVNTGSIQNKGLELLFSGYPIRSTKNNLSWNVAYSMSFNKGTVKQLVNDVPILSGAGSYTQEGHPLGDFLGWKQLGVFAYDQSNAFDASWNQLTPVFSGTTFTGYTLNGQPYTGTVKQKKRNGITAVGGDVNWLDVDKNGIIDNNDRVILGNAQPKWLAGFTNNVNYKDFTLSVVFYGQLGGKIYNAIDASQSSYGETGVTPRPYIIYNAWNKQGDITDVPDAKLGSGIGNTTAISSRYIEDASYIRLRNVQLAYTLPASLGAHIGARRVVASISGNNLLTWSNYIGFDPEMSFNNPLQMGVESSARIPRKNEIIFGLMVNF